MSAGLLNPRAAPSADPASPSPARATRSTPPNLWWAVAAACSIALIAATCLLFVPHFEVNDDIGMEIIASGRGAGGIPDPHLIFTHSLIGYAVSSAYLLAPGIPWYGLYLLTGNWVAFTVILRCWLSRRPCLSTLAWFAVTYAVFGLWPTAAPQFTMTAWLVGTAGMALVCDAAQRGQSGWRSFLPGLTLLLVCGLIRDLFLVLVVGVSAVPILVLLWEDRRAMSRVGFVSLLALVLSSLLFVGDKWLNYSDPRWTDFFRFHLTFSDLMDRHRLVGLRNKHELARQVQWSENDLRLLELWGYWDERVFTTDRVERFHQLVTTAGQYPEESRWERARAVARTAEAAVPFVMASWLLAGMSVAILRPRNGWMTLVLAGISSMCLVAFLILVVGRLPPRIAFPVGAAPMLLLLAVAPGTGPAPLRRTAVGALAMAFLVIATLLAKSLCTIWIEGTQAAIRRETYIAATREVKRLRPVALVDVDLGDRLSSLPLSPLPRDVEEGTLAWGWHARTPTYLDRVRRANLPVNYREMVGNGTLFLVRTHQLTMIQRFLAEHDRILTRVVPDVPLGQLPGWTLEPLSAQDLQAKPNAP